MIGNEKHHGKFEVYQRTHGVFDIARVRALIRIPAQFAAGIIADRFNRKYISLAVYLLNAVLAASFLVTGDRNLLAAYVIIFLLQGTQDVDNVAQTAMLPELVRKEDLVEANSTFQMLGSIAMLVGPGLGAALYKSCGSGVLYLLDALSFASAAGMIVFIKYPRSSVKERKAEPFMLFRYAKEGFGQIVKSRHLIMLLLVMMGLSILGRFYEIDKIYLVSDIMGRGEEDIVYFSYAMSAGSLLAPLAAARFREKMANWRGFAWAVWEEFSA